MGKVFTMVFLFCFAANGIGQDRTITGEVTDKETNESLPGVTVLIEGTSRGVSTNLDGEYSIEASDGQVLVFSFVGYQTQSVPVNGQTEINVALETEFLDIDEVVVVGYSTQKKSLVTGAISKVDADDLNKNQARVEQALQGKTAGVNMHPQPSMVLRLPMG